MLDKIKNKHLLIDGDIIKYRCAASAEKTKYLVECVDEKIHTPGSFYVTCDSPREASAQKGIVHIWSRKEVQPLEFALQAVKTTMVSLEDRLKPSKISIFLSPKKTFRDSIAKSKPYKGNRDQPKPKYLKDCEEYLIGKHGAILCDNVEADDAIGAGLTADGDNAVSVSIDKDLLQVPGWHYNWVNDRVQYVTNRGGDLAFYTQMLTGDATDNVPGLQGVGPVTAREILSGVRSRVDAATRVWSHYKRILGNSVGTREFYMEQANLLWILRGGTDSVAFREGYVCPIKLDNGASE